MSKAAHVGAAVAVDVGGKALRRRAGVLKDDDEQDVEGLTRFCEQTYTALASRQVGWLHDPSPLVSLVHIGQLGTQALLAQTYELKPQYSMHVSPSYRGAQSSFSRHSTQFPLEQKDAAFSLHFGRQLFVAWSQ